MHKAQKPVKQQKQAKKAAPKKVAKVTKRTNVTKVAKVTKSKVQQFKAPVAPLTSITAVTKANFAAIQQPSFTKPSFAPVQSSFRATKVAFDAAADAEKKKIHPTLLEYSISSPNFSIKKTTGYAVYVATTHGERGILRGSKPLVATLRPGVIKIYAEKDQAPETTKKYFAPSGVVRVANDDFSLEVTASELIPVEELDGEAAKKLLDTATAAAAAATDAAVKAEHTITMRVANAIIKTVEKYQKA